ncbi:MAG: thiamine pyrophosphate-binding protein [Fibrobacteres bacterium]|jgi:acetolactate synthase-1/2/3 large subunit|nr:thiamine pyrophosphate-binding protein [Fibrobacterota bacterium]
MIKVSDYIARRLSELGASHVFMVTGGGAMHLNDSFARVVPYQVVYNHHEQACAIAAEGLYRASGKIGVVNITTGPGGLNTITGLMGQWTDSVPAIYVSGQVKHTTTLDCCRELPLRQLGDQEVDIIPVVRPLVKYAVSIKDPKYARLEVEKAFQAATTGRMGPVWIDVPMDVQGAMVDEATLVAFQVPSSPARPGDTRKIIELLAASKRPVLVPGHGVRLSGTIASMERILEKLGIPAVATFNGFDLLPSDHPSFCGRIGTIGTRGGNFTLQNADLVILLGTRNNIRQVSYNWENFAHRAVTVSVDIDEAELAKPTFRPKHAIHADLRDFLPSLEAELAGFQRPGVWDEWTTWAKERNRAYPAALPAYDLETERIHPYSFFRDFTRGLPEGATVVAGNGSACVVLFQAGEVKRGQRIFWNSGCASMGFDLPAAIGASAGREGDIWCLAGDGSLQMNLQELATVGFRRMPVKLVVLENGGYASIRQTQANFFKSQYGCGTNSGLGFPDMEILAKAYGIPYVRSASLKDVAEHQKLVAATSGPVIWEVKLKLDYSFEPKLSSEKLPDGRMVSKPLEDMFPFLPREEFARNMLS